MNLGETYETNEAILARCQVTRQPYIDTYITDPISNETAPRTNVHDSSLASRTNKSQDCWRLSAEMKMCEACRHRCNSKRTTGACIHCDALDSFLFSSLVSWSVWTNKRRSSSRGLFLATTPSPRHGVFGHVSSLHAEAGVSFLLGLCFFLSIFSAEKKHPLFHRCR